VSGVNAYYRLASLSIGHLASFESEISDVIEHAGP
jgi:hypothetical protein